MRSKTTIIVQARSSSTRLPLKVLLPILGKPLIIHLLERISHTQFADNIVLATSSDPSDDLLASIVQQNGFNIYRGSLNNVLKRFFDCATLYEAENIVRITGDCPLMDPQLIDEIIENFDSHQVDYLANMLSNSLSVPDGFDVEIFTIDALRKAYRNASLDSDLEHVTPWIKKQDSGFRCKHFIHNPFRPFYRLTVDDQKDFEVVNEIFSSFRGSELFHIDDIVNFMDQNPLIASINCSTLRNEGYLKSTSNDNTSNNSSFSGQGQLLWSKAKSLIAGGNMLLSKNPDMFLPDLWPSYFKSQRM